MPRLDFLSKFLLALTATVLLFVSAAVFPPLGVGLFPFVPQPVLWFGLKYGVLNGMGVAFVAMVGLLLLGGKELALVYSLFVAVAGLLFVLLGRLRAIERLVVGTASVIFVGAAMLLRLLYGSWSSILQEMKSGITDSIMSAVRMYEKMDIPQESLNLLKDRAPEMADMALQILPAMAFIGLALIVLFNVLFLCRRFPDRRAQWLAAETLREWKAPDALVWGLIVCGFIVFIPGFDTFKLIAVNILLVVVTGYFFQGLAIVAYFFHKNNVPRIFRGMIYFFIAFQQICTLLVAGLGLFDLWGDFRRLNKKDLNPSQVS
jgi:uncharacterized protein YybS (DUF2232 family)